jgi:hypothetical protein
MRPIIKNSQEQISMCDPHMIENDNDYICPDCIELICNNKHND